MTRFQKMAWGLGLMGLIPFLTTAIMAPFVADITRNTLEAMQFAYAGIIIIFMGGVQWGYAIKQGDSARSIQIIISIMPALMIFGLLSFLPLLKPFIITIIFVVTLIMQAIFDNKIMIERWFIYLRWFLTSIASLSLIAMAIIQY